MMKKLAITLALAAGCSPTTVRRGLHYTAIATEIGAQGSLACDAGSTRVAIHDYHAPEQNPIMGDHPGGDVIGAYFVGSSVGVAAYNRVLPDILRVAANVIVIGAEFSAAVGNSQAIPTMGMCGL